MFKKCLLFCIFTGRWNNGDLYIVCIEFQVYLITFYVDLVNIWQPVTYNTSSKYVIVSARFLVSISF